MGQTFKVGDRVECIDGYDHVKSGPHKGWTGTIRSFYGIDAIVTWDGKGVRSEDCDQCDVDRLRAIDAPSLEDRIAALEAEVKALKEGQGAQPAQPTYAFGDPVEVYVDDKWLDGFVISPLDHISREHKVAIVGCGRTGYDERGDWGYFNISHMRPRVK